MKKMCLSFIAIFMAACSSEAVVTPPPDPVKVKIIEVESNNSFSNSDSLLKKAIEARDLTLFAVVNHGEGAMSVAAPIGQSKLYIFGNPKSGTPLMHKNKKLGLELPMKILVYEDASTVKFAYKDMAALASSYDVNIDNALKDQISRTLDIIIFEAAN